jgi:hypothetical protein
VLQVAANKFQIATFQIAIPVQSSTSFRCSLTLHAAPSALQHQDINAKKYSKPALLNYCPDT